MLPPIGSPGQSPRCRQWRLPWRYLLVPHDRQTENARLAGLGVYCTISENETENDGLAA